MSGAHRCPLHPRIQMCCAPPVHPMPCRAVLRQPSPFYSASGTGLMTAGSPKHICPAHAYLKCWPEVFCIFYLVLLFLWFSLKTQLPSTESSFELPSQWSVTFSKAVSLGAPTPQVHHGCPKGHLSGRNQEKEAVMAEACKPNSTFPCRSL